MSSTDRTAGEAPWTRLIYEAHVDAYQSRCEMRAQAPNPSMNKKMEVAISLSNYRDLLSNFHDENALETSWEERSVNVDAIEAALMETTKVPQTLNRRGNPEKARDMPMAAGMSWRELNRIGKELDFIAKELGFAPQVNSGKGDLYAVKRDPDDYDDAVKDDIPKPE